VKGSAAYVAARYSVLKGTTLALQSGFHALDARTGARRWFVEGKPMSAMSVGTDVYAADGDSLVALDLETGARKWSTRLPGLGAQAPVIATDRVFVVTSKEVLALHAESGSVVWKHQLDGAETPPIVLRYHDEACRSGDVERASWVSADGRMYPSATLAAAVRSRTLIVTAPDGIRLLNLVDGHLTWQGQPSGVIGRTGNPVVVGSRLYVTDFGEVNDTVGAIVALESAP
jgi:outer membrane protein assembly factor BamB